LQLCSADQLVLGCSKDAAWKAESESIFDLPFWGLLDRQAGMRSRSGRLKNGKIGRRRQILHRSRNIPPVDNQNDLATIIARDVMRGQP
jgi:hypothetical protein